MSDTFQRLWRRAFSKIPTSLDSPGPKPNDYSDISAHLPVLSFFASRCSHVTEFGTRTGESTLALIRGCRPGGEVHSYDIEATPLEGQLAGASLPCSWVFHRGDTTDPGLGVADTDLLLVDTLHFGDHVRKELALWGRKARKYIVFHDTWTCGERDLSGPNPGAEGIMPAIREFVERWGDYEVVYETTWNNGLLVYERV